MNTAFMKNIPYENIFEIKSLVNANEGEITSKTIVQNKNVSLTAFAFSKGEEISTHESDGDALVTVLEGTGLFIVDGVEYRVAEGNSLVMPAKKPHSVHAEEKFKFLLTVIFG